MATLVWIAFYLSYAASVALGRPTCTLDYAFVAPEYVPCDREVACCAVNQVTGDVTIDTNPTLTSGQAVFGGSLCPSSHPRPCCCTEEEYSTPPPISRCDTYSALYAYSSLACGTGQYKLCCNAPEWTDAAENHAAVPPTSGSGPVCSTDWSYPCCCDGSSPEVDTPITPALSVASPALQALPVGGFSSQAPASAPAATMCTESAVPVTQQPVRSTFFAGITYFVPSATEYCFSNGTFSGCLNITDLRHSVQTQSA